MGAAVDVVRRFRRLRALVIGDAILDSYLEGTAARLCSEGPVPVVEKTSEQHAPGGAANTAANLRALGAHVAVLGVVGRDVPGALLRSAFREQGIDDRWLIEDEHAATPHKVRILADGHYVVRFDEGDRRRCSAEGQKRLLANLEGAFRRCDLVVVSDYGYGVASVALIERLRTLRAARSCVLLVDSKDLRRFRHAGATVITPNHLEARLTVEQAWDTRAPCFDPSRDAQSAPQRDPDIEWVGRRLLEMIDAEHAAITMAAEGAVLIDRHGATLHLPAHPVPHANVVGAGDSFAAAMALALGAGASVAEAGQIAIDAAGIAVTRQGTAVVQHQELLQRVSLRDHVEGPTALTRGSGFARWPGSDGAHSGEARSAVDRLAARLAEERRAGRTIVFTNGVFDILHAGHIQFLHRAKELGDVLVVGVNSDRSARRLKGRNRPIIGERDRLALVAALDPVDDVVLFDEDDPAALIRALRPHIHVKGGDYADEALPEAGAVRDVGGRIVILPLIGSLSTTRVIDRIIALAGCPRSGSGDGAGAGAPLGRQPSHFVGEPTHPTSAGVEP
jgi:D-beta-D-heptose 7-phosphate kinase / D-beta-D-heptose 1-phosphate adenosyltransferase